LDDEFCINTRRGVLVVIFELGNVFKAESRKSVEIEAHHSPEYHCGAEFSLGANHVDVLGRLVWIT
jgi:hypothetical protein